MPLVPLRARQRLWRGSNGAGEINAYDAEALSNTTVTPPVGMTKYYVVVRNAEGEYKTGEVTINVSSTPAPTAPVVPPTSVCYNESAYILLNFDGIAMRFFDATGTTELSVGGSFTTPNLIVNTAYKVRAENINGCISPFTDFTVTVNPKPVAPVITPSGPTTFCSGGSVTLASTVPTNNALNFVKTSSQYISVPHSSSINLGATFTMEAWVNYSGRNVTIVDKGDYDFLWMLNPDPQGLGWNSSKMGFYNKNTGAWQYSTGIVLENTWTHVAITLSAGTLTFYVNGVAAGTAAVTFSQDNQPMNIGRQQPTACVCNHFNGSMDELRLWNVAKNQSQILSSMSNSVPTNSAGLVAYYKFDEGTGTTTADATSNGNNGTLVNNPTWRVPSTAPMSSGVVWSPGGATTSSIVATTSATYTATITNQYNCSNSANTTVTVNAAFTWTGATSSNWSTPSNWSCNVVPTSTDDAMIPSTTNKPMLSQSASVNTLTLMGNNKIMLGNNNLTVNGITGGSNMSFIVTNGMGGLTVKNVSVFAKDFPVGPSETVYAPAIVTNNVLTRDFTIRVGTTISGTVAPSRLVNLQWEVTPSVLTGNSATLALGWSAASQGVGFVATSGVLIGHYNGFVWDNLRPAIVTGIGTDVNPYVATAANVTAFSPFIVANATALSVELLDFKGTPQYNGNFLTWTTANEVNNKGFYVETQTSARFQTSPMLNAKQQTDDFNGGVTA